MNEPLTQLHAEAMTAEREWTVEEIPVLSASISLPEPVPAADKVSRRIRRYYQLQCRSFLRYCETYLLPAAAEEYRAALAASLPLPHFRAELTYQSPTTTAASGACIPSPGRAAFRRPRFCAMGIPGI